MKKNIPLFLIAALLVQCSQSPKDDAGYKAEMKNWRETRMERLKSENGWLNLVGLLWLKPGNNSFGSDSSNQIVFPPKAPARVGTITLKDSVITLKMNKDNFITVDTIQVSQGREIRLFTDANKRPTRIRIGSLSFYIIKRGDRYAIRLRDLESPLLKELDSIPAYPVNPDWKIRARLVPFDSSRTVEVSTVIDTRETYNVPGKLVFTIQGKEYSLLPFLEGKGYFLVFADGTSAAETYGAGRFLSVPAVDSKGYTIIDFNKATNPPCAFTPYATCPMPPRDNILPVKIEAGEKDPHIYKH